MDRIKNVMTAMTKRKMLTQMRKLKDSTTPPVIKRAMAIMAIMMANMDMMSFFYVSGKEPLIRRILLYLSRHTPKEKIGSLLPAIRLEILSFQTQVGGTSSEKATDNGLFSECESAISRSTE